MRLVLACVCLVGLCLAKDDSDVDLKAASQIENLGCQCDPLVFKDKYGRTHGNCKSVDKTGAQWCYLPSNGYSTCTDISRSTRFQTKQWSYEACATPAVFGAGSGGSGGIGGIGGCIDRHGAGCGDNFGTGGSFQQPIIGGGGTGCTSGRCGSGGSGNTGFGGGNSGCTNGRCGSGFGSGSSGCTNGRCGSGGSGFGSGSTGCVNGRCLSGGNGFGSISDRQETRSGSDNSAVNFG